MGRHVESFDLRDLLARNVEHPRFTATAERCLSCGNCTLVCPTCFCTSVDDVNVLAAGPVGPPGGAERWRRWDSCYSVDYSHIHGGSGLRLTSPRPIGLRAAGMHVLASGITILSYVPRRT